MASNVKLDRLRQKLQEEELDAILVSAPENRRYLSGFSGSAGYLFITDDDAVLKTDFRYTEQAGNQAPDFEVERITGSLDWFPEMTSRLGAKRIGFESQDMTYSTFEALKKATEEAEETNHPELVPTSSIIDRIRAFKTPEEIAILERAVQIADEALDEVSATIVPGMTEEQVAWEIEKAMRERGAETIAFDTIVGAGPNGALPHHRADETVIKNGDMIVIDMGARYLGYNSDLTRTIFIGEPDDKFKQVYNTVLKAQLAAEEQAHEGMTGGEIDAISRKIIDDAGYEGLFGHSLGHGVGLAVHEYPRVGPNADDELVDGMVFTVEPGIYISGWGGVRIEDVVVMENGRARVLSKARKIEV